MSYAIVNLEGRLVNDPEFRQGKENKEFCTFRVAVNMRHGEQEKASFYNCTGGDQMSQRIRKAGLKKGRLIHVVGRQEINTYQTRDGQMGTSVDVSLLSWDYVGPKPKSEEETQQASGGNADSGKPMGTIHEEQHIDSDDDELPL